MDGFLDESTVARIGSRYASVRAPSSIRNTPHLLTSAQRLEEFRDIHASQTMVLIGNGPSLNDIDFASFEGLPTIGLNRIYLKFEEHDWECTYHVCVNDLVVEQCAEDLLALRMPRFVDHRSLAHFGGELPDGMIALRSVHAPFFSTDPTRQGVWQGATVTYVGMQLAYFMGARKLILVGVDHRFESTGEPHQKVVSTGPDPNHFADNYFGSGFVWQLPDLETSERAYRLARDAFARDGREIVDCTVGGALRVFRRGDLAAESSGA